MPKCQQGRSYDNPHVAISIDRKDCVATGFFVYVALSTKSKHVVLGGFDKAKA
jgi:hypothetical protein